MSHLYPVFKCLMSPSRVKRPVPFIKSYNKIILVSALDRLPEREEQILGFMGNVDDLVVRLRAVSHFSPGIAEAHLHCQKRGFASSLQPVLLFLSGQVDLCLCIER